MSDITANIVVQSFGANIAVEENNINITPTDIQLRVFAGGYATASGNTYDVQYNGGGILAGDANFKYYPGNTTTVANNLTVSNNSSLGQATAGNLYANSGTVGASLLTGTLTTASQPNVTSVGTLGNLSVSGNVTANYFIGNGSQLTGLDASLISNGNSNVQVYANSNVGISVAGNSNIAVITDTGVNIAGYLNATGNITFNGPNVSIGNASNLKITGGANSYFLQTDGAGNLTWAAGTANITGNGTAAGANTQIQISNGAGGFTSATGFTFDNASNVLSAPGNANFVGNVSASYFIGNGSQLTGIDASYIQNGSANVRTFANANVTISAAGVANVATFANTGLIVSGNVTSDNANLGNLVTANFFAGTLTTAAQPNITSLGNLTTLNVSGTTSLYEAIENVQLIANQTGLYNFNMLDGSIQFTTAAATANLDLNFRGNSTITANTMLDVGESITSTYVMQTGTTPYTISAVNIDGTNATIRWVGGVTPTLLANSYTAYTFTIIKTASTPTYILLASGTPYR